MPVFFRTYQQELSKGLSISLGKIVTRGSKTIYIYFCFFGLFRFVFFVFRVGRGYFLVDAESEGTWNMKATFLIRVNIWSPPLFSCYEFL